MSGAPPPGLAIDDVPVPLLQADPDGRLVRLNPPAADLLGGSVFDLLDRPLAEILGQRPLETREAGLAGGGRLVALVQRSNPEASSAGSQTPAELDLLADRLSRVALGLPATAPLVSDELFAALCHVRALRTRERQSRIRRALAGGEAPPPASVPLEELLRGAILELAPWVRLAGADLTRAGPPLPEISGHADALALAIEEALLAALGRTGRGGELALRTFVREGTAVLELASVSPVAAGRRGAAAGLADARQAVAWHGGALVLEEAPGAWRVVLELPVEQAGTDG